MALANLVQALTSIWVKFIKDDKHSLFLKTKPSHRRDHILNEPDRAHLVLTAVTLWQ